MIPITLNIQENKFNDFINFIKTLNYVKVEESNNKFIKELQNSLKQVKKMRDGKTPKQTINQFLDEL